MKLAILLSLILFSTSTQASYLDTTIYSKRINQTKTELNVKSSFNNGGCRALELEKKLKKDCSEDGYRKCLTVKRKQNLIILSHSNETGWITKDICEVTIKGLSLQ